jgi:hypothetical protein
LERRWARSSGPAHVNGVLAGCQRPPAATANRGDRGASVVPDLAGAAREVADTIDQSVRLLAKLGVLDQPLRDPETLARDLVWDLVNREDAKRAADAAGQIMQLRWTLASEALEPPPAWWSGDLGQLVARALPPADPDETISVLAAAAILQVSRASLYGLIGARVIHAADRRGRVRLADVLSQVQQRTAATTSAS